MEALQGCLCGLAIGIAIVYVVYVAAIKIPIFIAWLRGDDLHSAEDVHEIVKEKIFGNVHLCKDELERRKNVLL